MGWRRRTAIIGGVAAATTALVAGSALARMDFGQHVQDDLAHHSNQLFGFAKPVPASSTVSADPVAATAGPHAVGDRSEGPEGAHRGEGARRAEP